MILETFRRRLASFVHFPIDIQELGIDALLEGREGIAKLIERHAGPGRG